LLNETTLASVLVRTINVLISPQAMARMRAAALAAFPQASDPNLVLDHDAPDRDLEDTLLAAFRGALTANNAPPSHPARLAQTLALRAVGSQLH
jgi:hypothetical protein